MLYYDRFDACEGNDLNKVGNSKECDICHYWYFLNNEFKFKLYVCNWCNELLIMSMNLSNIYLLTIKVLIIVVLLVELVKVKS